MAQQWRGVLEKARKIVGLLPADQAGRAVLTSAGLPCREDPAALVAALEREELVYHEGRIRGAFPQIVR